MPAEEPPISPPDRSIAIAIHSLIRFLLVVMALLVLAGIAAEILKWSYGIEHLYGLIPKFRLNLENNVPSWFSTICLFLCAQALALLAAVHHRVRDPLARFWATLAVIFLLMSLDEAASFHERLMGLRVLLHTSGVFYYAWVIPGLLFAVAVGVWSLKSLSKLPRETRRSVILAGLIFCSGALGMELLGGLYMSRHSENLTSELMAVLEESLEMFGTILFLRALLLHIARSSDRIRVHFHTGQESSAASVRLAEY